MSVSFIFATAYVLSGLLYVIHDLRKPILSRPGYAQDFNLVVFGLVVAGWFPIAVGALRYRLWNTALSPMAFCVFLSIWGILLS